MGAPPEVLARARADAARRGEFSILPCNLEAARVFWALSTQWRVVGGMRAARVGLDYTAIRPVLEMLEIPDKCWPGVFDSVRIMEAAALAEERRRSG